MNITTQVSTSDDESRKRSRHNGIDYISNLPESVISDILSCLPTKDAVRTSVLSKDWEFKWHTIYKMNIKDRSRNPSFVDFVDRMLFLSQKIKTFKLSCYGTDFPSSRTASWISALLKRNVESLRLTYFQPGVVLPRSLLNNSSLRKLLLELPCTFKVPSRSCFPSLKILYLFGVDFRNELSNTDTLVFTFPVIVSIELVACKWSNVKFVEFFAPALTTFRSEGPDGPEVDDYCIKIAGPKLERFESSGGQIENIILNNPPLAIPAFEYDHTMDDLKVLGTNGLKLRRLLHEFSNSKELELSYWATEAIAQSKQGLALPTYNKVTLLYLEFGTNIDALLELLHSTPSLETLDIEMSEVYDYDYDVVESMPSCFDSHLVEVRLRCFGDEKSHLDLAKFLFKNCVKLQKCRISFEKKIPKNEIMEQISAIPKASTCHTFLVK